MQLTFTLGLTLFIELISTCISGLIAYLLLKTNTKGQIGNKFLAAGIMMIGVFTFVTFIYSLIAKEWAIKLFLIVGMSAILIGVNFLLFTMKILIHSSEWIKKPEKWVYIGITVVIISILAFSDFITVEDEVLAVTTFKPIPLYSYAVYIMILLIYASYTTFVNGIKKTEGHSRVRMQYFFAGLQIFILALITDMVGNFFSNLELLFDFGLFGFLALGMALLAGVFLTKQYDETGKIRQMNEHPEENGSDSFCKLLDLYENGKIFIKHICEITGLHFLEVMDLIPKMIEDIKENDSSLAYSEELSEIILPMLRSAKGRGISFDLSVNSDE